MGSHASVHHRLHLPELHLPELHLPECFVVVYHFVQFVSLAGLIVPVFFYSHNAFLVVVYFLKVDLFMYVCMHACMCFFINLFCTYIYFFY